ncbi:TetR/AcrR family transcriptional regulator [Specibacter sp. RAF43]|uniref:TetR/AcrR family transcriptional regulator n=1 Tax=Specibacter sp. RAF43 TaxID=3233057 RepID=UPI003F998C24
MTREDQILESAAKLFSERSYDGVGVDAIAKVVGITGSAIYRHFSSKDEILAALFDRVMDQMLIRIGTPSDDPREELNHLVEAHVEFAMSHQTLAGIWAREQRALTKAHQRNFLRRQGQYIDRWIACLDQCFPGHPREELVATVRALHGLITSDITRPLGSSRPAQLEALLTRLAYSALGALELENNPAPERA